VNPGIVSLHMKEWSDHYRSSHYLMSRLSLRWPVVWIDPPHEREAVPDVWRRNPARFTQPMHDRALYVYRPPALLPAIHRPARLRRALERARLSQAVRHLRRLGCDRVVLYCWHPQFLESSEVRGHDLLVYHAVDEYSYSPEDPPTPPREVEMIRRAGQVVLHSPGLMEKKGDIAPDRTAFVPNGVDYAAFRCEGPEPPELVGIPRPRIGYCGVLKRQLNWELLRSLIAARRDRHWVFVGHWQDDHAELAAIRHWLQNRDNVHLTGRVPAWRLGEFPSHFDAAIMPYVEDGYTRYIYPLKLHEYLAAGIPIIGTPVRTLQDFGHVVRLARTTREWEVSLDQALAPESRSEEAIERRRSVAREHDWSLLSDHVSRMIELRLREDSPGADVSSGQPRRRRAARAARTRPSARASSVP
jgi:glycosyltransferase involved in cell wall biosynthesis